MPGDAVAFFAAGVTVGGASGLVEALSDRIALGIVAGLVVGKFLGRPGNALRHQGRYSVLLDSGTPRYYLAVVSITE